MKYTRIVQRLIFFFFFLYVLFYLSVIVFPDVRNFVGFYTPLSLVHFFTLVFCVSIVFFLKTKIYHHPNKRPKHVNRWIVAGYKIIAAAFHTSALRRVVTILLFIATPIALLPAQALLDQKKWAGINADVLQSILQAQKPIFFVFFFFLTALWILVTSKYSKKYLPFAQHVFFITLILFEYLFISQKFFNTTYHITFYPFIKHLLIFISSVSGGISVLHTFDTSYADLKKEKQSELGAQLYCIKKFRATYPRLQNIPAIGRVTENIYKQGWFVTGFLGLFLVTFFFLTAPLSQRFLTGDEFHIFSVAQGLLNSTTCVAWNQLYDTPGYTYTSQCILSGIVAFFFFITQHVSIFVAKLPSLIVSVANIFLIYSLLSKIGTKQIALFSVLFYVLNPLFIYESAFIRGYIYIVFLLLLLTHFVFKMIQTTNQKKVLLFILLQGITLFTGYKIHLTFITVAPFVCALWIWKLHDYAKKTNRMHLFSLIVTYIGLAGVWFAIRFFEQKNWATAGAISLQWKTFDVSFFTFPPTVTKIIFGIGIAGFLCFAFRLYKTKKKIPAPFVMALVLIGMFVSTHIIYAVFADTKNLILRYMTNIIVLNVILLPFFLFLIIRRLLIQRIAPAVIILLFMGVPYVSFWTSDRMNRGWDNTYNIIDMYSLEEFTSPYRAKEKWGAPYTKIKEHIEPSDTVAIITELVHDPTIQILTEHAAQIELFCLRFSPFQFINNSIYCAEEDYYSTELRPIKYEAISRILESHDKTFIVFPSRKNYKFMTQTQYINDLFGFQKISGTGFDTTYIDVYLYERR